MRWHRLAVLLALAGCGGGVECTLAGCVSALAVQLPAGVTTGEACIEGICATTVVDGALQVPLGRRAEGGTAQVTLTLGGNATVLRGEVPLTRSPPSGPGCPSECVTGAAVVDLDAGTVLPAPDPAPDPAAG
jgi:hypothetical protein